MVSESKLTWSDEARWHMDHCMRLDTKPGELVKFHGVGGYPFENEQARKALEIGKIYEVEWVEVGSWSSSVTLKGIEKRYNTVMFENVENK